MSKKQPAKKIPKEVLLEAQQKLDQLLTLLNPYLVALSPAERQACGKIGAKLIKFLELTHGFAVETPELFPSFVKRAVFSEEFFTLRELWIIAGKIDRLKSDINDTEMLAGSGAMEAALAFYRVVKMAAMRDIPGARVVFDELKPAFPSKTPGRRQPKKEDKNLQPELFKN